MIIDTNQRIAVNSIKNGCIVCGSVGSGKSRVSLTYFFEKECGGSIEPPYSIPKITKDLYIITTARKRDTKEWEDELKAFTMFEDYISNLNITIDSWNNIKKYTEVKNAFFIFDEQRVVGSGTWVNSFYKITSSQRYINNNANNRWILLSATPGDDWKDYIPVFVANKFFRNASEFLMNHAVYCPFTSYRKIDKFVDTDILQMYRASILVDIETKKRERVHNWVTVNYDEEQYRYVTKNRWNVFENKPIDNAAEFCYILRKVVNENESRLNTVKSIFDKYGKVIVFYNFDYELDILRLLCHKNNITKAEWNGHKHELIPETDRWLYLVQYTAGAEGWNCIETNVIVFFSLNYSYKATEQASGRIDRRNTSFEKLYYYHIVTTSWIDRAIRKALANKKNFNVNKYIKDF